MFKNASLIPSVVGLLMLTALFPAVSHATGCADGQREGFVDLATYPDIAGCAGAWDIPGILISQPATSTPACQRSAGDDGSNPSGTGCNVTDLCAKRWHVCESAAEVAAKSPTGCNGAVPAGQALLFAMRQSSNGCNVCATGTSLDPCCDATTCCPDCLQTNATANDVYGCGNLTPPLASPSCGVLDQASGNACMFLPFPWSCAGTDTFDEAKHLVKLGTDAGGVLCCRDEDKVLLCHFPPGEPDNCHEISVPPEAVKAHVKNHGDIPAPCPVPCCPGPGPC